MVMQETFRPDKQKHAAKCLPIYRLLVLVAGILLLIPEANPARLFFLTNADIPLLTTATSLSSLLLPSALEKYGGWLKEELLFFLQFSAIVQVSGIFLSSIAACLSLGNNRMKKCAVRFAVPGAVALLLGLCVLLITVSQITDMRKDVAPIFPFGMISWSVFGIGLLALSVYLFSDIKKEKSEEKMQIAVQYKLFLMLLPVLILTFIFSYLPVYGWRLAFFNNSGKPYQRTFVNIQWFSYMFENTSVLFDLLRVLRNTLIMSGLTLIGSIVPLMFAAFMYEIRSKKMSYTLQTAVIIPGFLSWPVIFSVAVAIFSPDGFFNHFLINIFNYFSDTNYLKFSDSIWMQMTLWYLWKNIGINSIIYLVAMSTIDKNLFEAAKLEGATPWQRIRHISLPSLKSLFSIMLLMGFSEVLSSDLPQYLLFANEENASLLTTLDLYIYNIGVQQDIVPYSTVISICKSIFGLLVFFMINRISLSVRKEKII